MVHFVGAGPGAVDLITVRGLEMIKKADIIIYTGSLVNPELLSFSKKGCTVYNSANMTLENVIDIIVDNKLKTIVRLHTGDPSLYGAIREQMALLDKNGIVYDVCPGVSSFCAAAASVNAEFTLPGISQTLILTRMEGKTLVPKKESIKGLSSHNTSMAIFLSAGMLEKLSKNLVEGGYSKDTPAKIVYKASWPDEIIITCTVSTLYEQAKKNNITKTAMILVGDFLGDSFDRSKLYDPSFETEFRKAKK